MSINNVQAVSDALKYVNGAQVTEEKSNIVKDVASSALSPLNLIFAVGGAKASLTDTFTKNHIHPEYTVKNGKPKVKLLDRIKTGFKNIKPSYEEAKAMGKELTEAGKLEETITIAKDGKEIKKTLNISKNVGSQIKTACSNTIAQTELKAAGKAAEGGLFSRIGNMIKGTKAGTAAGKAFGELATKFPKLAKAGKVFKGTGAATWLVWDGVMGVATEVIPAFKKGGVEAGLKQLGKTGVKTVANAGGWAVGSIAGEAIGSAIGSAICPGAGTVVGGAIGKMIGAMAGSALFSGIAGKIMGKSESEKAEDAQYEQTAAQVAQDSSAMNELTQLVQQKVQEDINNGKANKDTEKMAKYLNEGALAYGLADATPLPYTDNSQDVNTLQYPSNNNQVQPSTGYDTTYWNNVLQQLQTGDTSAFNISDEKMDSVFQNAATNPFVEDGSSDVVTQGSNNVLTNDNDRINYFG